MEDSIKLRQIDETTEHMLSSIHFSECHQNFWLGMVLKIVACENSLNTILCSHRNFMK